MRMRRRGPRCWWIIGWSAMPIGPFRTYIGAAMHAEAYGAGPGQALIVSLRRDR